jgi:hypothetical protein
MKYVGILFTGLGLVGFYLNFTATKLGGEKLPVDLMGIFYCTLFVAVGIALIIDSVDRRES